jgi:hypothetical protein
LTAVSSCRLTAASLQYFPPVFHPAKKQNLRRCWRESEPELQSKIAIEFLPLKVDTEIMDIGEVVYISSRLVLGALASFFAIMLWSKTRDVAWMLMVIGTIAAYIETVYSILDIFGITRGDTFTIGSVPVAAIVLPCLPTLFFIIAFLIMVVRKYRR